MNPLIIIGNGISGVTAAREIRKKNRERPILIISGETDHHYSRTALMYIFMGHMNYEDTKPYPDDFWEKNNIKLKRGWVTSINVDEQSITMKDGATLAFSDLILATGSSSNKFGWPGQDLPGVQGLYSYQDLEILEKSAQSATHAVIIGGGLIGVEMAEMLLSRGIGVTFLVREKAFWNSVLPLEEAEMIGRHLRSHHLDLRFGEELDSIHPGPDGHAARVTTKRGEEISCQIVGLTVGVHPNIDWLRDTPGLETDRGILIDHFFRSSLPHIWSLGDCAQFREPLPGRRPIEQVWYTGKMQACFLAENIEGNTTPYAPGIWWNSAKFFDVEYQTYGIVLPNPPEDQSSFYWENPKDYQSVRINYDRKTHAVCGVNIFGIRHRHNVWEQWIKNEIPITQVLTDLGAANFDPEFFRRYETEIITRWNEENPGNTVTLCTPKGLFSNLMRRLSNIG